MGKLDTKISFSSPQGLYRSCQKLFKFNIIEFYLAFLILYFHLFYTENLDSKDCNVIIRNCQAYRKSRKDRRINV